MTYPKAFWRYSGIRNTRQNKLPKIIGTEVLAIITKIKQLVPSIFVGSRYPLCICAVLNTWIESDFNCSCILTLCYQVPQQENGYDCGLFALFYMEHFIQEAPDRFCRKDLSMVRYYLLLSLFFICMLHCFLEHTRRIWPSYCVFFSTSLAKDGFDQKRLQS